MQAFIREVVLLHADRIQFMMVRAASRKLLLWARATNTMRFFGCHKIDDASGIVVFVFGGPARGRDKMRCLFPAAIKSDQVAGSCSKRRVPSWCVSKMMCSKRDCRAGSVSSLVNHQRKRSRSCRRHWSCSVRCCSSVCRNVRSYGSMMRWR